MRYISYLTAIVFLTICLSQSASIIFYSDGKGIAAFEQRVAAEFDADDLVIFWDRYANENYGPPLYFLYGTQVVFDRSPAFEPELYAMLMKDYVNVYIATSRAPTVSLAHPYFSDNDVVYVKSIVADDLQAITAQCDVREYILEPDRFLGYYQFDDKCSDNNPPTRTKDYSIILNIYQYNRSAIDEFIAEYYDPSYRDKLMEGNFDKSDIGLN